MLNPEITVGNIVAILAAFISAWAVIVTINKERTLRKKDLADRVRQSTALIIAKLDRWKQLSLQALDELQPAVTEADIQWVDTENVLVTRDHFWKKVVSAQAALTKCVLAEEIEISYVNLYSYDPRIHQLFAHVIARLRDIESLTFSKILNRTQYDIFSMKSGDADELMSAELGNKLRCSLAEARDLMSTNMEEVLSVFRSSMMEIIYASDSDLVNRAIKIPASNIIPGLEKLESSIFQEDMRHHLVCERILDSSRASQFGRSTLNPWPLPNKKNRK